MANRRLKYVVFFILALWSGILLAGYGLFMEEWTFLDTMDFNRYRSAEYIEGVEDVEERFKLRGAYTRRACERLKGRFSEKDQNERSLVYIREKKTSFCPIEKVASTFWKRVLYSISKPIKSYRPLDIHYSIAYAWIKTRKINLKTTLSSIVDDSLSLVFVRDPYTRLFAGWLDKFYSVNLPNWIEGRLIIKIERNNASEMSMNCGYDVSFKELVSYVSKKILAGEKLDPHFHTSCSHCDVCNMHFRYIGKYETLEEDAKFIVDRIPGGENLNLGENFKINSVSSTIKDEAEFLFSLIQSDNKFSTCVSVKCAMFRAWQRFVCRGIIGTEIPFPYTTEILANQETKESFINKLTDAHNKSNKTNLAANRQKALAEAYSTLDTETIQRFLEAFDVDFELFGYSKTPAYLNVKRTESEPNNKNYRYLQDCPY